MSRTKIEWDTAAGRIVGFTEHGVSQAIAIRYATAERYRPPQAAAASSTPIMATGPGVSCPQPPDEFTRLFGGTDDASATLASSEDCLRLTVRCPATQGSSDAALPVMVYIHGGAYVNGAGDSVWHDTSALVRQEGVIVVTVTYRLGLLGYADDADGRPANLGLLDQLCALQWVHRNIGAFGGDAGNVTCYGHSAGADAILHLMIVPGTETLFHRAILQSAPLGVMPGRDTMVAAMRQVAQTVPKDADIEEIVQKHGELLTLAKGFGTPGYMPFGVQYGVHPLPKEADLEAAYAKIATKFDVLIGCTQREVAIFAMLLPPLYYAMRLPVVSWLAEKFVVASLTHTIYAERLPVFAAAYRRHGGKLFTYRFNSPCTNKYGAAAHGAELPLLFRAWSDWKGAPYIEGIPPAILDEQAFTMKHIWAQFARTGEVEERVSPDFISISKSA